MLAQELVIVDGDMPEWESVRPLVDSALRLEQSQKSASWHGWTKEQIDTFLKQLPPHCTLLLGVWETRIDERTAQERDLLVLGCACEVVDGSISSVRTVASLVESNGPSLEELEPSFEHAYTLMQSAKRQIAPVAWALFTDRATWNEWVYTESENGEEIDKGELLAALARQGRCVLMGNQTAHKQR